MSTHPITAFRESRGMTKAALAEAVECKKSMMTLIEQGARRPSPDLAQRLQNVTGIDARVLLGITTDNVSVEAAE